MKQKWLVCYIAFVRMKAHSNLMENAKDTKGPAMQ